ncbi:hypothetical protein FB473_001167 [Brooklawnia cerclae]|uniref:DUF349 domain-containing protein n=1 Tax=Brooklawnia cerclae TaxID=349934 RepID=A0ABX0SDR2_9ACTN|nr:DUF349 domain-containing protein [Brooklawnia cerclae]NIH56522.1 hypothetical protein [Brooklawnia cerclae]
MSESAGPASFGRVEDDGTVYVVTSAGERRVGQVPDVDKSEALAFFVRRFESLETEVGLLVSRVSSGSVSPEEARKTVNHLRGAIAEANAVGDLESLTAKLEGLVPLLAAKQEERKAQRAQQNEQTRAAKEAMVAEAEKLAAGNDWRGGVNRFRSLLDQWKALPRIDRATDDELWHRFSGARTTYTRRRKSQFASENERREDARKAKEQIIERARQIADSTDWSATAAEFRDLMQSWKAAGGANRDIDDKLWAEFRGLQDQFFNARSAAFEQEEAEFRDNQTAKEQLLGEAEGTILPVSDVKAAREAFRDFLTRYNAYGKVPRDAIRPLDNRVRAIEQAIKAAEDDEWRRTDPEARKRAADTVEMFTEQINKLAKQAEAAEARGDHRKAAKTRESIETYNEWLAQAQRALDEFTA